MLTLAQRIPQLKNNSIVISSQKCKALLLLLLVFTLTRVNVINVKSMSQLYSQVKIFGQKQSFLPKINKLNKIRYKKTHICAHPFLFLLLQILIAL